MMDLPCGSGVENPPANVGDMGSIPGPGRSHRPWDHAAHAKPMHHNYWACALEPKTCNYWAHVPQLPKACVP